MIKTNRKDQQNFNVPILEVNNIDDKDTDSENDRLGNGGVVDKDKSIDPIRLEE